MNKKLITVLLLIGCSFALFANPFISPAGKTDISEVGNEIAPEGNDKAEVNISGSAPSVRISSGRENNLREQRNLREILGEAFYSWKELSSSEDSTNRKKASSILSIILGVSFLFGIVHALGPGHRKTIVFSLYLSRKAPWWEPLATGTSLSVLHAGSAVIIIILLNGLAGSISQKANFIAQWMEGVSYLLLITTAVILIIHSTLDFINHHRMVKEGKDLRRKNISITAFIISGIYPCPGAVLVLVLSFTLNIIPLGILSVLSMSLGMSIPIIASAYLAWAGREGLFHVFKSKENSIGFITYFAEISGYTLLFAFSLYIAWPFITSLIV